MHKSLGIIALSLLTGCSMSADPSGQTAPGCGNGVVEAGEECDDSACCTTQCTLVADSTPCSGGSCQTGTCVPFGEVPAAVTGFSLTSVAPTSVSMQWSAAVGASDYRVIGGLGTGSQQTVDGTNIDLGFPTTTTFVDSTSFVADQEYYWRICGRNAAGEGPCSPNLFAVPNAGGGGQPNPAGVMWFQKFDDLPSGELLGSYGSIPDTRFGTSVSGGNDVPGNPCLPWAVTDLKYAGTKAIRFTIPGNTGQMRSEISLHGYDEYSTNWEGKTHWIGWAARLDSNWPVNGTEPADKRTVIMQVHSHWQEPGKSPTWGIRVRTNGEYVVTQEFECCANPATSAMPAAGNAANDRGQWVRWVVNVRYSGTTNGFIRIWKDDVLVLDKQNIMTWEPTAVRWGWYKVGLYASWMATTSALTKKMHVDQFRIADQAQGASYATVNPIY
jgi:hypothetical protein